MASANNDGISNSKITNSKQDSVSSDGLNISKHLPLTPGIPSATVKVVFTEKLIEEKPDIDGTAAAGTSTTTTDTANENINKNNSKDEIKPDYIAPEQNPYVKTVNYMEEHSIMHIFQHLTSGIVYQRPDDPLQYMVDELERMKTKKSEEGVYFPGS
ncbi:uncharacterized protein [Antedon mediterranea]|uniref:uncharacterized protein n=1 Tax=Antedon mediterranea TaxID=105859 RepID=UPI003AF6ADF6